MLGAQTEEQKGPHSSQIQQSASVSQTNTSTSKYSKNKRDAKDRFNDYTEYWRIHDNS